VGLVAIGAAIYLVQAGQVLASAAVVGAMLIIVFVKGTPPRGAREWKQFTRGKISDRTAGPAAGHLTPPQNQRS
jgi:hypothetical protein